MSGPNGFFFLPPPPVVQQQVQAVDRTHFQPPVAQQQVPSQVQAAVQPSVEKAETEEVSRANMAAYYEELMASTRPQFQPEPEPLLGDYMATNAESTTKVPEMSNASFFLPNRPDAPPPNDLAEAPLVDNASPSTVESPIKLGQNVINPKQRQAHMAQILDNPVVVKALKSNISLAWRDHFTATPQFPEPLHPVTVEAVEFDSIEPISEKQANDQGGQPRRAVATCSACHAVVDVVEFIRHTDIRPVSVQSSMYDGSTLDQMDSKLKKLKKPCIECDRGNSAEFTPSVWVDRRVQVELLGSLNGAIGDGDAPKDDPSLYKIAPDHVKQQSHQLNVPDALDTLPTLDADDTPRVQEIDDKGAAEEEPETLAVNRPENRLTHFLVESFESAALAWMETKTSHVGSYGLIHIGHVHHAQLAGGSQSRPRETELLFQLSIGAENSGSREIMTHDAVVDVFTVADQYLAKANPSRKPITSLSGNHAGLCWMLTRAWEFVTQVINCPDVVMRELQPCELVAEKTRKPVSAYRIERAKSAKTGGPPIVQVTRYESGVVSCRMTRETLLDHLLESNIRLDETRDHTWFHCPTVIAPWLVVIHDTSLDHSLQSKLSKVWDQVMYPAVYWSGTVQEVQRRADHAGVPIVVKVDSARGGGPDAALHRMFFDIRRRDDEKIIHTAYLDLCPDLNQLLQ